MTSRSFGASISGSLAFPGDSRAVDAHPAAFGPMTTSGDMMSVMGSTMLGKRRFDGEFAVEGFRRLLPEPMARGMQITNAGITNGHAAIDESVTSGIVGKRFVEAYQMDYSEMMPLFSSTRDPETSANATYSVYTPQLINYALDLAQVADSSRALRAASDVFRDTLEERLDSIGSFTGNARELERVPETPLDAEVVAESINYLGPLVNTQQHQAYTNVMKARRASNEDRLFGYTTGGRARIFNVFSPTLRRGEMVFMLLTETEVTHLPNYIDPRAVALDARRTYGAPALQLVGCASSHWNLPSGDTSYDVATKGTRYTRPRNNDVNYVAKRELRAAADWTTFDWDDITGKESVRADGADTDQQGKLAAVPQHMYEAYLRGAAFKVGFVRDMEGPETSEEEIKLGLRTHADMQRLNTATIYAI